MMKLFFKMPKLVSPAFYLQGPGLILHTKSLQFCAAFYAKRQLIDTIFNSAEVWRCKFLPPDVSTVNKQNDTYKTTKYLQLQWLVFYDQLGSS